MSPSPLRIAAVVGVVAVLAFAQARHRAAEASLHPVRDRPTAAPADGYVTSDTCRSCHPRQYATWEASYHRTMTQLATDQSVIPSFDGVVLEHQGVKSRLEHGADGFTVTTVAPDAKAAIANQVIRRKVVMTTGSHSFQAYWFATDVPRELMLFRFCYQIHEKRWIPVDSVFIQPPGVFQGEEAGLWNRACSTCHTTHIRPRLNEPEGVDTQAAEFGIACEACHGPAQEHVRQNRDPLRRLALHRAGVGDPTMVQPAKLSHRRGSEVCGQCHSVTEIAHNDRYKRWAHDGSTFRPGGDLEQARQVVRYNDEKFWKDGMVRVSGREYNGLLRTPCFTRGEMSCFSCHQMHPEETDRRDLSLWSEDQLKPGMDGNLACLQCHGSYGTAKNLVAHTHHPASSEGSRCYNCHAPYTTYGLQKAIRSHEISSPSVQESVEVGRPNACNLCHLDRTLAWTGEHLQEWYHTTAPPLPEDERSVAAGVLWLLRGDAGQRALAAWHMGWEPARAASGTSWTAPYLAHLLADPYSAVRAIAYRSLLRNPGFTDFDYDFLAPTTKLESERERAFQAWDRTRVRQLTEPGRKVLLDASGTLIEAEFDRLAAARDDRPMWLVE